MSALRLARAVTGREHDRQVRRRLPRPRRRPARRGGLGPRDAGHPGEPRRHRGAGRGHRDRPLERPRTPSRRRSRQREPAAILAEPMPGEHGRGPAGRRVSRAPPRRDRRGRRAARLRRGDQRLPRRPRGRPGAPRGRGRPDGDGQGDRRRAAGRGLRRPPRADGADRARPATSTRPGRCRGTRWRSPPAWRRCAQLDGAAYVAARRARPSGSPAGLRDGGRRPSGPGRRSVPGLSPSSSAPSRSRDFAGAAACDLDAYAPLLPRDARARHLSARLPVRGLVRLARPRRRGDRPDHRGRRGEAFEPASTDSRALISRCRWPRPRPPSPPWRRCCATGSTVISPHVVDSDRGAGARGCWPPPGPRAADAPEEYAPRCRGVREGYLLHYGSRG